jgi:hypothetical protein
MVEVRADRPLRHLHHRSRYRHLSRWACDIDAQPSPDGNGHFEVEAVGHLLNDIKRPRLRLD